MVDKNMKSYNGKSLLMVSPNLTTFIDAWKKEKSAQCQVIKISKANWGYLIERKIHQTAEYIASLSYQTAVQESRNFQDSSEWKLSPTVFKQICSHLGKKSCLLPDFATNCHDTQPSDQIIKMQQQMHFNRIENTNFCMLFPILNDRKDFKES